MRALMFFISWGILRPDRSLCHNLHFANRVLSLSLDKSLSLSLDKFTRWIKPRSSLLSWDKFFHKGMVLCQMAWDAYVQRCQECHEIPQWHGHLQSEPLLGVKWELSQSTGNIANLLKIIWNLGGAVIVDPGHQASWWVGTGEISQQ